MAGNLKKFLLLLLAVFLVQATLPEVNAYHGHQVFYDDPYYYGHRYNYYSYPSYYTHHQYHYIAYQDHYARYNRDYYYYPPPPRYYRYNTPYGRCRYPGDICVN